MLSAVSSNEALHIYVFHIAMKNNVGSSRQGEHKLETKTIVNNVLWYNDAARILPWRREQVLPSGS